MIKSKKIFAGKLLKLYLKGQRYPNGYIVNLEIVKHPGAVLIVPFLDKRRIILIKQYRPVINSYIWELPAGTLKKKEIPLQCARRELLEEIGYKAKTWKRIGYIFVSPGYTTEKILIFVARGLKKAQSQKEADELIFPQVFEQGVVKRLLDSGRIVDAKTICALKLAHIL